MTGFCLDKEISCHSLNVPVVPHFLRLVSLVRRFEKFQATEDVMIYSGNYAPLAVKNHIRSVNIFYCHTPPRFLYDKKDFYLKEIPVFLRPAFGYFCAWYRKKYENAVKKMDIILANSENTRRRIKRYLEMDSTVLYPPVDTEQFKWLGQEDFFLSAARIDPLKRIELIVRAFMEMPDQKLKLVSDGPDLPKIRTMVSGSRNIQVLGWVSQPELIELTGKCRAAVYIPRDEDFGISPIESMAAGKPVIGVSEGGLLETILDGRTGFLLPPGPGKKDLINAVSYMTAERAAAMKDACEQRAKMFGAGIFLEKIRKLTENAAKKEAVHAAQ